MLLGPDDHGDHRHGALLHLGLFGVAGDNRADPTMARRNNPANPDHDGRGPISAP
jgi:hypothetical protein